MAVNKYIEVETESRRGQTASLPTAVGRCMDSGTLVLRTRSTLFWILVYGIGFWTSEPGLWNRVTGVEDEGYPWCTNHALPVHGAAWPVLCMFGRIWATFGLMASFGHIHIVIHWTIMALRPGLTD